MDQLVNTRYKTYLWEADQVESGAFATHDRLALFSETETNPIIPPPNEENPDGSIGYEYMVPVCTQWDDGAGGVDASVPANNPGLKYRRRIVTSNGTPRETQRTFQCRNISKCS